MNEDWVVDIKGGCKGSWEISVIHKDNEHGFRSYGWFGEKKILISHNGGPCRWPIAKYVFDQNIKLAEEVAQCLNSGYTYEELMGGE